MNDHDDRSGVQKQQHFPKNWKWTKFLLIFFLFCFFENDDNNGDWLTQLHLCEFWETRLLTKFGLNHHCRRRNTIKKIQHKLHPISQPEDEEEAEEEKIELLPPHKQLTIVSLPVCLSACLLNGAL